MNSRRVMALLASRKKPASIRPITSGKCTQWNGSRWLAKGNDDPNAPTRTAMGLLNAGARKKHENKRSTHRAGNVDVSTSLAMTGASDNQRLYNFHAVASHWTPQMRPEGVAI